MVIPEYHCIKMSLASCARVRNFLYAALTSVSMFHKFRFVTLAESRTFDPRSRLSRRPRSSLPRESDLPRSPGCLPDLQDRERREQHVPWEVRGRIRDKRDARFTLRPLVIRCRAKREATDVNRAGLAHFRNNTAAIALPLHHCIFIRPLYRLDL